MNVTSITLASQGARSFDRGLVMCWTTQEGNKVNRFPNQQSPHSEDKQGIQICTAPLVGPEGTTGQRTKEKKQGGNQLLAVSLVSAKAGRRLPRRRSPSSEGRWGSRFRIASLVDPEDTREQCKAQK
jgi:hypothetical protein